MKAGFYFNNLYPIGFNYIFYSINKIGFLLPYFCHQRNFSCRFFPILKKIYSNRPLHKNLGKIYVFGVLLLAAPGAYILTLFINRGLGVFASFLVQNTLRITFTLAAWLFIKKGRVDDHIRMMRRSYSLAFAAVTLKLYIWLFTIFGHRVSFHNNYIIIAFSSWVPNLLLAEWINYRHKKAFFKLNKQALNE
ncbi:hypothetical protein BH09BAC6_BH09BAC6_13800 [soil metagenome]|jgi:uncharacterized membrane protein